MYSLARFNWGSSSCIRPSRTTHPTNEERLASCIHVDVANGLFFGLELDRFDQIVVIEIVQAVRIGLISATLGYQLWEAWCGTGNEVMRFGDVEDMDLSGS